MIFKYISSSIDLSNEIGFIAMGPITVIIAFLVFIFTAVLCNNLIGHLPEHISKFISLFGVVTVFDPIIIMLVNIFSLNFDCENRTPACKVDYTSSHCHCFTGND